MPDPTGLAKAFRVTHRFCPSAAYVTDMNAYPIYQILVGFRGAGSSPIAPNWQPLPEPGPHLGAGGVINSLEETAVAGVEHIGEQKPCVFIVKRRFKRATS